MYEFLHTNSSLAKGCLILENLKKNVPNYAPGQYPPKKVHDLASFFGDLSRSEKHS